MRSSRLVLALLLTTGLTLPTYAQEAVPHFRLSTMGVGAVPGGPPTQPGEPTDPTGPSDPSENSDPVVRYNPLVTTMNETQTGDPIYDTNDVEPTGFVLRDLANSNEVIIDPSTGRLTWTPVNHSGPRAIEVGIFTRPNPDTMMDWPDLWTTVDLEVDALYEIALAPDDLTVRLGQEVQPNVEIDVEASGYDEETWHWWFLTNGPFYSNTSIDSEKVTLEFESQRNNLARGGNYYFHAMLQNYDDGRTVYSDPVRINVVGTPYFDWPANTTSSSYRIFDTPGLSSDIIYLKRGESVSIPAPNRRNGASSTVVSWPDWIDPMIQSELSYALLNAMPPGLSINSSGAITGTASSADEEMISVMLPTISNDARHGLTWLDVIVVDELPATDPQLDGGGGDPTDPEEPGPPDADGDGTPDEDDRHPLDPSRPGPGGAQCYDPAVYYADSDHMMCTWDEEFERQNPRPAHVANCADPMDYWFYRGEDCAINSEFEQMYPGHVYGSLQIGPFFLVAKREHSLGNLGGNGAYCDHTLTPTEISNFDDFEEAVTGSTVQQLRENYKAWSAVRWSNAGEYPDEALHSQLCVYAQQYPSYDPTNGSATFMIEWSNGNYRSQTIIENLTEEALGGYVFP